MCYRTTQVSKIQEMAEYYSAPVYDGVDIDDLEYYQAVGFSHPNLAVISSIEGQRNIEPMQWGLMPNWKKPLAEMLKLSNNTLNAKSETIFDLVSFKNSIMSKRCILPVNSFFEFKEVEKDKLPYLIQPKEGKFFNLACIYSFYQNPETKDWIKSFSIVTTPANSLMAEIHNTKFRQPVILDNQQISNWLNPDASKDEIIHLMQPCDDTNMSAFRVHRDLVKLGNSPETLLPIE
ncbi:SOS response-associated peptidase [Pedobacter sp. MW01-1-1]|uniref:SOS response-associated peptidase n=1 Tax=Pedobacter sp. MW01-1-1 TaxID=3383027 RepID=UPI003FED4A34